MNLEFVKGSPLFARINKIPKQFKYLDKDIETDVIIVGGGVTGCLLGYYFSKSNINTVILEKNIAGYGSTSITTALLQYELDGVLRKVEEATTYENVIKSYNLGLKALNEIHNFIEEYGNECDYEERDTLLYTGEKIHKGEIYEEYKIRKENNFNVEFIDNENNPFSFKVEGGVYSKKGGAEIDPYKFTHQLIKVGETMGVSYFENTEAVKIEYGETDVTVTTKYDYKVKGKIVIVATGYNTKLFSDRNFGIKTTTYNIATKPLENLETYYNKVLIRDNKDPYNYFRTTKDGRIIAGGQDVNFIPDINNEKTAEEKYSILEAMIKNMFPKISNVAIEYKYCGTFASTADNLGFIGKDPDNPKLWYNLGYGANGILFAVLGGMMLSQLYLGKVDETLELFRIDRFDN